ncbi:octopamine receptor 2-like [Gigantopelta aegis]|uniref:octopamine receptor 2-like n=1 Tax=Gigantopelta aegis TaxID=1735272 RepID=UPI001B88AE2F|nr:octopamine receptor 2-like [Gigantopelta aegis]
MAQGSWNFSAPQTNGFSSTQMGYFQSSDDAIMSTPLYWIAGPRSNGTRVLEENNSFLQICDSNSTTIWKLSSPVCSTRFESFASVIIVAIVLTFITLWTIIGNVGVVLALYYYRTLRTMSNCLIGNLAISDLLLAITVLPISTTNDMLGYWVFGETMCTIWLCIDVLYCTASIWGLCIIAFDRYTATVYPMWYHDHRSSKKLIIYIVFVWVFSIIISFAPFIGWPDMIPSFHSYSPVLNRFECVLFSTQSYVFYSAIGSFVLPICLMVFLYIRIFSVIHKQSRSLKSKSNLSCFTKNTSPNQNGYPEIISPDAETNTEINMPRDETGLTVITEVSPITESTYFLSVGNLKLHQNSDLNMSESDTEQVNSDYENILQTGPPPKHEQRCHSLQISNPDSDAAYMLQSKKHCHSSLPQNGIRKTSPGIGDGQGHLNGKQSDTKRSKSVSIFTECSSDSSEEKRSMGRKISRALPWNLLNVDHGRRMTISMKRRLELREQRATKRMMLIMASFIFCWIPFLVMYVTRSLYADFYMNDHFAAAIIWLGYANSGLNPVLYTLFNEDFKKAFKKLLHIGNHRQPF